MSTITIHNLEDELIARIKIRARNNGLTIEEEVREFIIRHYRAKETIKNQAEKSDEY